jgi:hypothetical protein
MTIAELKGKTQYGDYTTLGQMLGITATAAKMRFQRGDVQAKDALLKIIEGREKLIEQFNESNKTQRED